MGLRCRGQSGADEGLTREEQLAMMWSSRADYYGRGESETVLLMNVNTS
jgi:hypothetical protein